MRIASKGLGAVMVFSQCSEEKGIQICLTLPVAARAGGVLGMFAEI